MENFEKTEKVNVEEATDMELASFLLKHIEKPCEDLHGHNIRDFYIREAEGVLQTLKVPEAKKLLEDAIKKYSLD